VLDKLYKVNAMKDAEGNKPVLVRLHRSNTHDHVFERNMVVSYCLSTKHFFHKFLYKQNVFFKIVSKKVSSIHKKAWFGACMQILTFLDNFSVVTPQPRTNLYMYLPEQYNRQNNSIASSQNSCDHFISLFLNGGPIIKCIF